MNRTVNTERGQAFVLVLLLLLVGSILLVPLLAFMSSGLLTTRMYEQRTLQLYAADGGIEDGIWRIMVGQMPAEAEQPYHLELNGQDVAVTIAQARDSTIDFFERVGALKSGGQGKYNKADPHSDWMVVYTPLQSDPGLWDTYRIEVTYLGAGNAKVENIGCWIRGLYDAEGKAASVTAIEPGSMSFDYPDHDFSTGVFLGTSFQWQWRPGKGPTFKEGQTRIQVFTFSPTITRERFPLNIAWSASQRDDIFISWTGARSGIYQVTAIARSPDTGKSTTIDCHLAAEEIGPDMLPVITVLTWEIKEA